MHTARKTLIGMGVLAALALAGTGCGKNAAINLETAATTAAPIRKAAAPTAPLAVNDLAASPATHLGSVVLVGVVGTVNANKGFVVVDTREFAECGLTCLTEAGTKKIPVRWPGAAPAVKDKVRIDGQLTKDAKGFTLIAEKVAKQ